MKSLLFFSLIISFISCSTNYEPESFNSKLNRYESKGRRYLSNNSYKIDQRIFTSIYNKSLKSRTIASVKKNKINLSNGELYFALMLKQYYKLVALVIYKNEKMDFSSVGSSYLNSLNIKSRYFKSINTCAKFHNTFIYYNDSIKFSSINIFNDKYFKKFNNKITKSTTSYYPELNIQYDENMIISQQLNDITPEETNSRNEVMKSSLNRYISEIYVELIDLCNNGSTNDYSRFISFIDNKSSKNLSSMEYRNITKHNVINNNLLIGSLRSNFKNNGGNISNDFRFNHLVNYSYKKLNIEWFGGFIDTITSLR